MKKMIIAFVALATIILASCGNPMITDTNVPVIKHTVAFTVVTDDEASIPDFEEEIIEGYKIYLEDYNFDGYRTISFDDYDGSDIYEDISVTINIKKLYTVTYNLTDWNGTIPLIPILIAWEIPSGLLL